MMAVVALPSGCPKSCHVLGCRSMLSHHHLSSWHLFVSLDGPKQSWWIVTLKALTLFTTLLVQKTIHQMHLLFEYCLNRPNVWLVRKVCVRPNCLLDHLPIHLPTMPPKEKPFLQLEARQSREEKIYARFISPRAFMKGQPLKLYWQRATCVLPSRVCYLAQICAHISTAKGSCKRITTWGQPPASRVENGPE